MSLETATFVDSLVVSNPDGADAGSTADDHLRLIKACLKRTFPLIDKGVSASAAAISFVNDVTAPIQNQFNELREGSATARAALVATTATTATDATNLGGQPAARYARLDVAYGVQDFTSVQRISCDGAGWYFRNITAGNNEKWWGIGTAGSTWFSSLFDDAGTNPQAWLTVERSGMAVGAISLYGTSIRFNGTSLTDPSYLGGQPFTNYARRDIGQTYVGGSGQMPYTVTAYSGNYTPNVTGTSGSNINRFTLSGSVTLGAPSLAAPGTPLTLILVQDSIGGRLVSWSTQYRFPGGATPVLSTQPGAIDVLSFVYDNTTGYWLTAGFNLTR
jgi:hypothetical protein